MILTITQTASEDENAHLFHQFEWIKNHQEKYSEVIEFHETALDIQQKTSCKSS